MPNQLRIEIAALAGKTHTRFVKRHMEQAAAYLKSPLTELSIVFVGDRRMIALHDQFMNLPTTTDVLTFPIDEDARGRPLCMCASPKQNGKPGSGAPPKRTKCCFTAFTACCTCAVSTIEPTLNTGECTAWKTTF
jgi:hypothetical protein